MSGDESSEASMLAFNERFVSGALRAAASIEATLDPDFACVLVTVARDGLGLRVMTTGNVEQRLSPSILRAEADRIDGVLAMASVLATPEAP